jgi:ankyrin repeat protein
VKHFNFAIFAAAALATLSAPCPAQFASAGTDFVEAVRHSDGDKVTKLLRDHPTGLLDARDGDGNTALIISILRRDEQWTGFLLNQGADPNLAGKGGDTPLIAASRVGFETGVEWLLSLNAKIDGTNRMGETALITAVQGRQLAIVRLLLTAGANPDKADSAQGYSARGYAERDPRARDILKAIEAKKPKASAAP